MGMIKHEDIVGVSTFDGIDVNTYCYECIGEVSDYEEEDIILESEVEDADRTYWCDCCKEALK